MTDITLNAAERAELFKQDPARKSDGGFQSFLVSLQDRVKSPKNSLTLNQEDLEKIPRYAFDYKNGGWQKSLTAIFGRHLGDHLGR
ncbi:MAG: hypothetical protein ACR2F8_06685 [Caulobacteraceae bacterium]